MKLALAAAILGFLAQADPKLIALAPPDKAKPDDIKKAADAMAARCKASGYTDLEFKVAKWKKGSVVEISRKDGLPGPMRTRIANELATTPGRDFDLCILYPLTKAEEDMYPAGGGKAPKGARWINPQPLEGAAGAILIRDGGHFAASDFSVSAEQADSQKRVTLKLSASGRKKLAGLPEQAKGDKIKFYADGRQIVIFTSSWEVKQDEASLTFEAPDEGQHTTLALSLKHPLPFPLTLTE
jgi:hypothetical protein